MVSISFTVYFEDPHWIGLIEERASGYIDVGKVVFGAEPSNAEITKFVLEKLSYVHLHRSTGEALALGHKRTVKPKKSIGGTKRSLEIYKSVLSIARNERRIENRRIAEDTKEEQFQRKQLKKKQKKQGH
jgi:hypothetical protein